MKSERRSMSPPPALERRANPERRDRMRRINTVHFVGIGGSGMSGIAAVLLNLGYHVQGSDVRASTVTQWLAGLGARISIGHAAGNVSGADVVVVSGAVSRGNPEVLAALGARIPIVARAEMLAELMRLKYGIATSRNDNASSVRSRRGSRPPGAGCPGRRVQHPRGAELHDGPSRGRYGPAARGDGSR